MLCPSLVPFLSQIICGLYVPQLFCYISSLSIVYLCNKVKETSAQELATVLLLQFWFGCISRWNFACYIFVFQLFLIFRKDRQVLIKPLGSVVCGCMVCTLFFLLNIMIMIHSSLLCSRLKLQGRKELRKSLIVFPSYTYCVLKPDQFI